MEESFTFDLLVKANKIIFGYPWLTIKEKKVKRIKIKVVSSTGHELLLEVRVGTKPNQKVVGSYVMFVPPLYQRASLERPH